MKKSLLLSFFAIVLCFSANGQWYKQKYGVDSLNEPTNSQLETCLNEIQLQRHKSIVKNSIFIPSATIASILLIHNANGMNFGTVSSVYENMAGVVLALAAFLDLPIALVKISKQSTRISQIREHWEVLI
jgi:hypothetical protein